MKLYKRWRRIRSLRKEIQQIVKACKKHNIKLDEPFVPKTAQAVILDEFVDSVEYFKGADGSKIQGIKSEGPMFVGERSKSAYIGDFSEPSLKTIHNDALDVISKREIREARVFGERYTRGKYGMGRAEYNEKMGKERENLENEND